ncbi:MAG: hypothetical protein ACYCRE_03830, partial [Acidobacteriaceae bacterium]
MKDLLGLEWQGYAFQAAKICFKSHVKKRNGCPHLLECCRENALQAPVLFDHAFDIGAAQAANQRGIDLPSVPIRDMLEGKRSFLGHAIHRIPIRTGKPQDSAYDFTGLQIV